MRGLNVNGFVIVETLGSGRSGLLYLARHPTTGQEAIIRLASNGDDGMTAKLFLEEAASLLPTASDVEPQVASDGSRVLVAFASPSSARTEPLPQARAAPGAGATQHEHTLRLAPPSALPRVAPLLILFVGLAALAAAVTVLLLVARGAPPVIAAQPIPTPPVVAAAPPPVAPAAALPSPVAPQQPPAPPPQPTALPQPASKQPPPERPTSARPAPPAVAPRPAKKVVCDRQWLRAANAELAALRSVVARRDDDALYRRYEDDEDRVIRRFDDVDTPEQCVAVDAAIDALLQKYDP